MPEIKSFAFRVEVNLALTRKEISHMMECSKRHGDLKCHAASQEGGFLIGWSNQMDWAEESGEDEVEVRATYRQMDTLCKILEVESMMVAGRLMIPEDSLYFPVKNILIAMGEKLELVEGTERALKRAHAAIQWFATVRAAITSGALRAHGESAHRGFVNILAVAHAASEVWLSGEPVTARVIADLLGWHAEHAELAVKEWLRPLQTGPYPPLVTEDGAPNIQMELEENVDEH